MDLPTQEEEQAFLGVFARGTERGTLKFLACTAREGNECHEPAMSRHALSLPPTLARCMSRQVRG